MIRVTFFNIFYVLLSLLELNSAAKNCDFELQGKQTFTFYDSALIYNLCTRIRFRGDSIDFVFS